MVRYFRLFFKGVWYSGRYFQQKKQLLIKLDSATFFSLLHVKDTKSLLSAHPMPTPNESMDKGEGGVYMFGSASFGVNVTFNHFAFHRCKRT